MDELDPALRALGQQRAVEAILRTLLDMHLNRTADEDLREKTKLAVRRAAEKSAFETLSFDAEGASKSARNGAEDVMSEVFGSSPGT
ncbi:hypothetical protein MMSR116_29300 [Methylobacterium mesophilicum SR1.6/6]|uniref:Uncharacterized protein n=1 Tax=Methylobacterium mesophilicum SR1.6/6 TaxID=908290 RepID=A0A6B9FS73_9HYPH|nr:hypothetical protein [Methylobacterium mesophilicum]QGY05533.1 hypothetical protein MMSR116_29300 [Methylobacterium mesophilicum SR1.6/6]